MHVKLDYVIPPGPGGHMMQVRWTEHQAECLETMLDSTCEAIHHMTAVCAHVRDLITNAAPAPVPMVAASILHMSFLALETVSHRECEVLSEAGGHIRRFRQRAVSEREWLEEEAKREREAAKAGAVTGTANLSEFAAGWEAQGCRNPDERKEAAE